MDRFQKMIAGAALLIGTSVNANLPVTQTDGCLEGPMAQFGQYLGSWRIVDSQLKPDGSGWEPGAGARWDWVCLGNGTAVQDFWLPTGGGVGTNLRTWNGATESWDIAWMFKGLNGFTHIKAKHHEERGELVLDYKAQVPDTWRRITFFTADANGWKWKMEQSKDEGKTWREVYRIVATPWTEPDAQGSS